MPKDILELTEEYTADDSLRWAKLASDVNYRRLHILLMREILAELRRHNTGESKAHTSGES
jgi:hypothetical protein